MSSTAAIARYHLREIAVHAKALAETVAAGMGLRPAREQGSPFDVFLTPDAQAINRARQEHLASLGLDLGDRRVLEVGAGIGLHTPFFLERGCDVLVTDGNPENVAEIRRRHPQIRAEALDLEKDGDLRSLGEFDLIYCYGLLYHLRNPEQTLARLAELCRGQILLETCVALARQAEIYFLRDFVSNNQAVSGIGCRPTRAWVMQKLRQYFGHAYTTRTQPDYPDFQTDWDLPETRLVYRAVFVGSKLPLGLPTLMEELPSRQERFANAVGPRP